MKREGRVENENAWKISIEEVKERDHNLDFKNPNTVEESVGDPNILLEELKLAESNVIALRTQLKTVLEEALTR